MQALYTQLHILRCKYNTNIPTNCDHKKDVWIECQGLLNVQPYDSQVQLVNTTYDYPSSGILEIVMNSIWGNICSNHFSKLSADSACRQMGYTGALNYSTISPTTNTALVDNVSCEGKAHSCSCLAACFKTISESPIPCSARFVHVTCTFDIKIQKNALPGGVLECSDVNSGCTWGPLPASPVIAIVVVIVLFFCAFLVALLCLLIYCVWRRRRGYSSINVN